jgi:hypothetical protein
MHFDAVYIVCSVNMLNIIMSEDARKMEIEIT